MTAAELAHVAVDHAPDMTPTLDDGVRWLALTFLRRYVTWCARSRHLERIEGAARLYQRLGAPPTSRLGERCQTD